MSMILVIQPHKMLQHAMALSLFPQYQTRVTSVIPEAGEIEDVDAVIVDAMSLRETRALTAEAMASLRVWSVPMIWIDGGESPSAPIREKLVIVKRPIGRQSLQKAVAKCLGESATTERKQKAPAPKRKPRSTAPAAVNDESVRDNVIELVDVVQESPTSQNMVPDKT